MCLDVINQTWSPMFGKSPGHSQTLRHTLREIRHTSLVTRHSLLGTALIGQNSSTSLKSSCPNYCDIPIPPTR